MTELQKLKESVERIELAICGDEKNGIEGIVKKVNKHDKQLTQIQRVSWGIAGAAFLVSLIASIYKLLV